MQNRSQSPVVLFVAESQVTPGTGTVFTTAGMVLLRHVKAMQGICPGEVGPE